MERVARPVVGTTVRSSRREEVEYTFCRTALREEALEFAAGFLISRASGTRPCHIVADLEVVDEMMVHSASGLVCHAFVAIEI